MVNIEHARAIKTGESADVVVYTLKHALGQESYRRSGTDPRSVSGEMLRLRRERARKPREVR
jgi:hypothetical protein